MNHYLRRQTRGKRFVAGLLDAVMVIVLALFLYVPILSIAEATGLTKTRIDLGVAAIKSGLYTFVEDDNYPHLIDYDAGYPKALFDFYVDEDYRDGEIERGYSPILEEGKTYNSIEDYYVHVLKKDSAETLFDFSVIDNTKPWEIKALENKETDVINFYRTEIEKAQEMWLEHPEIVSLYNNYLRINTMTYAGAYLSSALILIVIVPLFLKNKASLGKLITGSIVLNGYGFKMNNFQAIMRNIAVFIFSFVFFIMPFHIISYLFSFFNKKHLSLYDFLLFTLVADKKGTLLFKDVQEETLYRKDLAQRLIAVDRSKQKIRTDIESDETLVNHND